MNALAKSEHLAAALLASLRARQDEMTALLERLVEQESPSSDAASQCGVQEVLRGELESRAFRVSRIRGSRSGGSLYARPELRVRGRPYQLLLGHGDTVWPLGTLDRLPVRVADGVFRGPGSYDMKAGLVQGLFAVETLHTLLDGPLPVTPLFVINSDEEIGSRESTPLIRRLARGADRALVLEPSIGPRGKLKTARKGIGRFTITVRGVAAHAGLDPEKGASAILELSHVIQKLFALNDPVRGVTVNVGTIDGGLQPNVVAPESRAVVDVRVLTRSDALHIERVIHGLRAVTPGTALEIEGRIGRPPMERTPGNRRLYELAERAAGALGIGLEQETAGGGSDGNTTSQFTPTLDGLGAVGDGAHAETEYLLLERMPERAALLACLLAAPPLDQRRPGTRSRKRKKRRRPTRE